MDVLSDSPDLSVLYDELRRIAGFHIRRSARHPTLHPTMLVHEAWVKMSGAQFKSKTHFLSLASRVMRNVVVDYIRRKTAERRGGSWQQVTLELQPDGGSVHGSYQVRLDQVLDVDRALELLAELDGRKCRVVEMRFFGGMEFEEIAESLDVSVITVKRDWAFARAWLANNLNRSVPV